MNSFTCPNTPRCEHPGFLHDAYDHDDPYPTCCADGCRCGHPGDADLVRHADGTVTVSRADHLHAVIRSYTSRLSSMRRR